ncbi:MAG: LD-carboxypeptidase [Planctomycetota bacterium]
MVKREEKRRGLRLVATGLFAGTVILVAGIAGVPGIPGVGALAGPKNASRKSITPPALKEGDIVGLIAPASPLDDNSVKKTVAYLQSRGFGVKVSHGYRSRDGYLAGGDEQRAAEFNSMLRDPQVNAVFCLRGGYGSPRILDQIDYAELRRNPKIVLGYSDITAVLNAIERHAGVVSFHGPMAGELKAPTGFTSRYLWAALSGTGRDFGDWGKGPGSRLNEWRTIAGGTAEGKLVGGNLSLVSATMGTPYEVDTNGAILFLEEVSERPFRVDRMLNQLRLAGKLKQLKGALLCRFTNCRGGSNSRSLDTIFKEYLGPLGIPVLAYFPAGHVSDQATLPVGARVRLDATAKKLSIVGAMVRTPAN